MQYSEEFKEQMVRKMTGPSRMSANRLSAMDGGGKAAGRAGGSGGGRRRPR